MLSDSSIFSYSKYYFIFIFLGRVARAGRRGVAYSLVDPEELPYLLDVFMFLGKEWKVCQSSNKQVEWESDCVGRAPRSIMSNLAARIESISSKNSSLVCVILKLYDIIIIFFI